jgi:hypothetical protein
LLLKRLEKLLLLGRAKRIIQGPEKRIILRPGKKDDPGAGCQKGCSMGWQKSALGA